MQINTHQSFFTRTSTFPEMASHNGQNFIELLQTQIDEAINEKIREEI